MTIDTSKLKRYKPGYVHSNDGPGYISMLAREDGEYVRLEDVIAITIALEQALTQQRGELPSAKTFASAVWCDWMTNEQADKLGAELHAWLGAHVATTPQPSADAVRELVKRWRECAKSAANGPMFDGASEYAVAGTYIDCADELESLLSAASGEGVG